MDDGVPERQDIASSWRRAALAGVDPDRRRPVDIAEVDPGGRLATAARPVLEHLAEQLRDGPVSLFWADRNCRVVQGWNGDRTVGAQLEAGGVVPGSSWAEQFAGTNGLGTAFEVGHGVAVNGTEHYLNALKTFSCYGHPIHHPLTRRIEGVLDLTIRDERVHPLLGPLLARAARDVEERLLETARDGERRLFLAFQEATRHRSQPVAVLGGEVVLANRGCLDRLGPDGTAVLGALRHEVLARGSLTRVLDLGEVGRLQLDAQRVDGTRDGVVFRLGAVHTPPPQTPPPPRTAQATAVLGEPGTGRSTEARRVLEPLDPTEAVVLSACDALAEGDQAWAARLMSLVQRPVAAVVVEDVEVLSAALCTVVRRALAAAPTTRFVFTGAPAAELPVAPARLVGRCARRTELAPLRERRHELATLIGRLAKARELILTPRALDVLGAQPWPGNLVELRGLVEELSRLPGTRRVDVAALPERYRSTGRTTGRGGRERAERVAIVHALHSTAGNKRDAATLLGISRTTLYRRMRALDVGQDMLG